MKRAQGLILAAMLATGATASAGMSAFENWNLVVRNDVTLSTSEVDGSALIGGSLLGGTSNYTVQGVSASNGDGLAIGGLLDSDVTVNINNGGNFRIGSLANMQGTVNLNGGGVTITDPTTAATAASIVDSAVGVSAYLSTLTANGNLDGAGNMNAAPVMIGGQNVAVYEITQAQFNGLGQLNLNFGAADSVIINFIHDGSGAVDLTAPPNIIGGFNQANSSRIMWNFADATSITVNNSFNGAMLGTEAALTINGGGVNGTVIVDSIALQNAEIRRHTYDGFIPAPGAVSLMAMGGIVAARRRRTAA